MLDLPKDLTALDYRIMGAPAARRAPRERRQAHRLASQALLPPPGRLLAPAGHGPDRACGCVRATPHSVDLDTAPLSTTSPGALTGGSRTPIARDPTQAACHLL